MSRPKSPGPSEPSSLLARDHQMVKEEQIQPHIGCFPPYWVLSCKSSGPDPPSPSNLVA